MKLLKEINFKGYNLGVYLTEYQDNGRPAIILIDMEDGCDYAVATINVPNIPLSKDQVIIKNYSENEGILEKLIVEGIVSNPINTIRTGFVEVPVCCLFLS